ncbi:MAG TPA: oligoribonuclease [Candidatus Saccharimonadales bacterium]|nr:oligoribonuclease [Candidatus Saccharimonadales bacterium]
MDLKRITPTKLLWIDLEMTGLNPAVDRIVEVAAIITDWQFKEFDSLETSVAQNVEEADRLMRGPLFRARPELKKQLLNCAETGIPETEAEKKLLALINKHYGDGPALLAGNSIHTDRQFIRQWWPQFESRLHYRMLDVSAWKVVMIGRFGMEYKKKENHRALADIRESIAELEYYLRELPNLVEMKGDEAT